MKGLYITCAFLLSVSITAAQPGNAGSLKKELLKASQDSIKIKIVEELLRYYLNSKPDSGIYYARQMVSLSQSSGNKHYEALGFSEMGYALGQLGNYSKALEM
jgi:hypothetical protein